jgi:hypothetical protein
MARPRGRWATTATLAVSGALGFWVANFAISLTPIAAEYRSALAISYVPMLLEALVGGLIIGFGVGYCLLRCFDRIPTRSPILKSLVLGGLALVVVTLFVEVPSKYYAEVADASRYFLIATAFNALRILALAVAIGYVYGRLDDHEPG